MATAPSDTPQRSALSVFTERRTLVMMLLGFAAGLPYMLIFDTLSAWLRQVGLSLQVIGFFSLATLVSSFKFLWAPLIDRTLVPGLTPRLGHRRSWMLVSQVVMIAGLAGISSVNPSTHLGLMAALAVLVGFWSATQDIVIDAWRIEVADEARQGAMAAAYQWGYRGAMVIAGAVPLLLAQSVGWPLAYGTMAVLMGTSVAATLAAPREATHAVRELELDAVPARPTADAVEWAGRLAIIATGAILLGSGLTANALMLNSIAQGIGFGAAGEALTAAWKSSAGVWWQLLAVIAGFVIVAGAVLPMPGRPTRPGTYLAAALSEPLRDFFARYGRRATLILALVCVYRLSDFVLNIMNPFYLDLGFSLAEVAEVRKVFGVVATMLGVVAGGYAVARLGLMRALLIGAFGGPLSNLVFLWLATRGHDVPALFVAISIDNALGGVAGTCLIAYMSSLTTEGFTATQYALFSSLYAVPGRLIASQSGRIVESAARASDAGGTLGPLRSLFAGLPPESFAGAVQRSGVSPAALGAGYAAFFIYSCVIGVFAVGLTIAVMRSRATSD